MARQCAVTRAYESMRDGTDRDVFRIMITDPEFSGGYIARVLRADGYTGIDHMAVDHYRRKLRTGKAAL